MASRGRPKATEPREMMLTLRLTQAEYHELQGRALRKGQSIREYVREVALTATRQEARNNPKETGR